MRQHITLSSDGISSVWKWIEGGHLVTVTIPDRLRQTGLYLVHQQGLSPEEATREMKSMGLPPEAADKFLHWYRAQAAENERLQPPPGCDVLRYRQEVETLGWDVGEQPDVDLVWPAVEPILRRRLGEEALASVSESANVIRRNCAPPHRYGSTRRGLVVGYVQSGKTANYTALIAKAADVGYRGFIVLSGIHNALRLQTQKRLENDLVNPTNQAVVNKPTAPRWYLLTQSDPDEDFRPIANGQALLNATDLRLLAVVKKNSRRLRNLRDWLRDIPESVRRRCPFLLIDDEADQATPNTGRAREEVTAINRLLREIFSLLPTSTYIGYTATPFANVLIDPAVEEDFYPRDFIVSLPKPKGYFGPEALFGSPLDENPEEADDGYDLIRLVPEEDEDAVRPPSGSEAREAFQPPVPDSMRDAIRWFLLATTVRRLRQRSPFHSSMLIHTTQYSAIHFRQQASVNEFLNAVREGLHSPEGRREFEKLWISEQNRFVPEPQALPEFGDVLAALPGVLDDVRVIVDNSWSEDRLNYTELTKVDGAEREVPQTVIAIGGNTLSRGLTLEGLVVSYFVRSASTYDALLQMGRWFGFRPGYADLARVWVTAELASNFRFLAGVEAEIREDIAEYGRTGLTPRELGVRIRRHPSMAITSRLKMQSAIDVEISYAGERRQTFLFAHRDRDVLLHNLSVARQLLHEAAGSSRLRRPGPARWVFDDVDRGLVEAFLEQYHFHPEHSDLDAGAMVSFLRRWEDAGYPVRWNVAVIGSSQTVHRYKGGSIDLGTLDLGLGEEVGLLNRSRLKKWKEGTANIKSLMSRRDRVVDLEGLAAGEAGGKDADLRALRQQRAPWVGLLAIYPISKSSVPLSRLQVASDSRAPLEAVEHVIGVGIVFPDPPPRAPLRLTGQYVRVDLRGVQEKILEQDDDEWGRGGEDAA